MALDYLVDIFKIYGINMISYYRHWYAKKRLAQSFQTLQMMSPDIPPLVEAQHEMIQREVEYYREESTKFTVILLTITAFAVTMVILYSKGIFNVVFL